MTPAPSFVPDRLVIRFFNTIYSLSFWPPRCRRNIDGILPVSSYLIRQERRSLIGAAWLLETPGPPWATPYTYQVSVGLFGHLVFWTQQETGFPVELAVGAPGRIHPDPALSSVTEDASAAAELP